MEINLPYYLYKNKDILKNIVTKADTIKHYISYGKKENRIFTNTNTVYTKYIPNDYIFEYIYHNIPKSIYKYYIHFLKNYNGNYFTKKNRITIDPIIYLYLYDDDIKEEENIFQNIYNIGTIKGRIYSIFQLINYRERNVSLFWRQNELFIFENNEYKELKKYVNTIYTQLYTSFIEEITIIRDSVIEDTIIEDTIIEDTIEDSLCEPTSSVICCFIGDINIGKKLLLRLLKYGKNANTCLFIFKSYEDYYKLQSVVQMFRHTIIFKCKEYGNDIIPSLQSLHYLFHKYPKSNIQYIYKFHTKSIEHLFTQSTDYLLHCDESILIDKLNTSVLNKNSNCVGVPFLNINTKWHLQKKYLGIFCKKLFDCYQLSIDSNKMFVGGTIFFSSAENIKKILQFIENHNYQGFFLNNMYDSNFINFETSPVHFLERLFGCIQ